MELIGREIERETLRRLLDSARAGMSGALVLQGEPGIGKTSLLDDAVEAASDFSVVRISGYESERDLAFAGIQRVLAPFIDDADALPKVQRVALESAFGLTDDEPPNRFLVGLAALSLLSGAALVRPVLCVIDDAQWLDDESLSGLGFVARRLHADRIAMLFASRAAVDDPPLDGVPSLMVEGLAALAAHQLLARVVAVPVDEAVAARVVDEAMGSPIAVVEIGKRLGNGEPAVNDVWPEPLPLSDRLEAQFLRQTRSLPPDTQALLLVAAAEPSGSRALIEATAQALGLAPDAAEAAERAGLLVGGVHLRFRHPLMRSAVYGGATIVDRRRTHQVLAEASGTQGDADRRAWHLGAGAVDANEAVAAELHEAAERALLRGGCAASASFFTRAAELTPDRRGRADRALAAAERHLNAGFRVRSRHVLDEFASDIVDPYRRARAARLEGAMRYTVGEVDGTVGMLLDAARMFAPHDLRAARDTLLDALAAARIGGVLSRPGERVTDVASFAAQLPLPPAATPTIGDLLLDGYVALLRNDPESGRRQLSEGLTRLQNNPSNDESMLRWLGIGCWAAGTLGDDEALRRVATRLEMTARARGAVVPLALALTFLALHELGEGTLTAARAHLVERDQLMALLGRPPDIGRLLRLAWDGDESGARDEVASVVAAAQHQRHGWMLVFVDQALVVLELGLGNYPAALASASASYRANPFFATADFPNLVEAAVRSGETTLACDAIEQYGARRERGDTPLGRSLFARAQALVADDAEGLYRESIDWLDGASTVQHARARLLFGEWLRRQQRRTEAREQLRAARDLFSVMGANAFAARAERELAATGEHARRRGYTTFAVLTPQESQIGQLAAAGATNQEIAGKLFLSASTVDYHLRKVYRKLGVTSRRQLGQAMPP